MALYHPELGEAKPNRLFHARHVINGTYSIRWNQSDDAQAREILRKLRIRPSHIRLTQPEEYSPPAKEPRFSALITSKANVKLNDADVSALECLLD